MDEDIMELKEWVESLVSIGDGVFWLEIKNETMTKIKNDIVNMAEEIFHRFNQEYERLGGDRA